MSCTCRALIFRQTFFPPIRRQHMSSTVSDYRLFTSVLLEYLPVVNWPLNAIEQQFMQVQNESERRRSLFNDFELRQIREKKRRQLEAEGKALTELTDDLGHTAWEVEDSWKKEAELFMSTLKDAGHEKSHRRLLLVVRQSFQLPQFVSSWLLPQTPLDQDETLRQSAERLLAQLLPPNTKTTLLGNTPIAVHNRVLANRARPHVGAKTMKVFFFRALIKSLPAIIESDEIIQHKWIQHNQLNENIREKRYASKIRGLLIE